MLKSLQYLVTLILIGSSHLLYAQSINSETIRIKLRPETANKLESFGGQIKARSSAEVAKTGIESLDNINEQMAAVSYKRVFRDGGKYEKRRRAYGLHLWYEVRFDNSRSRASISSRVESFRNLAEVQTAEPIYTKSIDIVKGATLSPVRIDKGILNGGGGKSEQYMPNDPRFSEQWHYNNTGQTSGTEDADIDLPEAWNEQKGVPDVIVSVHDGGIDFDHEDLVANMWVNEVEANGTTGVDDDGNGYIDDIYGYDFADDQGEILPKDHGTHVAGTIAAVNNNSIGVSGIAGGSNSGDGIRLMSCQVFGINVDGFPESYAYAADNGAVISQNSWGYTSEGYYEQAVLDAIDYFIANAGYDSEGNPVGPMQGGLVIFAAGNDDSQGAHYPGYYEPTLAVASTNHNDLRSWYSNYGTWVDIAAPGGETSVIEQGVLSTLTNDTYGFYQGTSMACPHVSGVAALIVSEFAGTGIVPSQVRARLTETSDDIDALNPNYSGLLGSGRLNAANALLTDDGIPPETISDLGYSSIRYNEIDLTWTAPIDSDNGSATVYEIRYSENLIDEGNFESADLLGYPIANEAGTVETYLLGGLTQSTTYYIAIRSSDFFGNTSAISNVLDFTTPEPPIMGVSPGSITEDLFTGETSSQILTVSNTGSSDLIVFIDKATVGVSTSYEKNKNELQNIGKGENDLTNYDKNISYTKTVKTSDLSDKNVLYFTDIASSITENTLANFDVNVTGYISDFTGFINDLNSNEWDLVIFESATSTWSTTDLIAYISNGGKVISYNNDIPFVTAMGSEWKENIFTPQTIYSWEPTHLLFTEPNIINTITPNGSDLFNDDGDKFEPIAPSLGLGGFTASSTQDESAIILGNDETTLLNGFLFSSFAGVDNNTNGKDDIQELLENEVLFLLGGSVGWLNYDITEAVIAAGSTEEINVEFNAAGLNGGTYEANIIVNSNDPITPSVTVPITLNVTGAPDIDVTNSLDFGQLFIGSVVLDSITISNTGTDLLTISSITNSNSDFSLTFDDSTLDPNQTTYLKIEFTASSTGTITDQIEISSDDPDESTILVDLSGSAVEPPIIGVTPDSITDDLLTGETSSQIISISNTGSSDLEITNSVHFVTTSSSSAPKATTPSQNHFDSYNANSSTQKQMINTIRFNIEKLLSDSSVIFSDDMESTSLWSHYPVVGSTDMWSLTSARSNSGSQSWNVAQHAYEGSDALESPSISLTGTLEPKMSFVSWYEFDDCSDSTFEPDGLLVQVSNDGGSTWNNIPPIAGYPYVLDDQCNNPIALEEAFSHNNGAFVLSTFDLVAYTGQEIKVRFYAGWDCGNCTSNEGFYLDDFVVYEANNWASLDISSDVIAPGNTLDVEVNLNATGLYGGVYEANIIVDSNDPLTPEVTVPVTLNVTGAPDIDVPGTFEFDEIYTNQTITDSLLISNVGTDVLSISDVSNSNSDFTLTFDATILDPEESTYLKIEFTPSSAGVITDQVIISSDDPDEPTVTLDLSGSAIEPPVIEVNPTFLTSDLYTGETEVQSFTISNTGQSDLVYALELTESISGSSVQQEYNLAEHVPPAKGQEDYRVGNPALSFKGDDNGGFGYSWIDSSEPGGPTFDWVEISSTGTQLSLGDDNYVQVSLPFDFEFYGETKDVVNVSSNGFLTFNTNGASSLGNTPLPSSGSPNDLIALMWTDLYPGNSVYYLAESDRFIVQYNNVPLFGSGGSYTFQVILYPSGNIKIQYLSLSSAISSYTLGIENATGDDGMEIAYNTTYIENNLAILVSSGSSFITSIEPTEGLIGAGESETIDITFDTNDLFGGTYEADITILSNDPITPTTVVPVTLNVTGAPNIEVVNSLEFDEIFVGATSIDSVLITNTGTDVLTISEASNTNSDFVLLLDDTELNPYETTYIRVEFSPSADGTITDQIVISSNDPNQPTTTVELSGAAINPPIIISSKTALEEYLLVNEESSQIVTISNTGSATLEINNIRVAYSGEESGRISTSTNRSSIGFYADETRIGNSDYTFPEITGIEPLDLGDTVDIISTIPEATTGAIVIDQYIYFVSYFTNELLKYDIATQSTTLAFPVHVEAYGIAFDGENFWIGSYTGNVYGYNLSGDLIGSFSCPFSAYPAITWNGSNFIVSNWFDYQGYFYEIDYTGSIVTTYTNNDIAYNFSMVYVPSHESEGGGYWGVDFNSDKLNWFDLSDDTLTLLASLDINLNGKYGYSLAHDGQDLLFATWEDGMLVLDDGINEISWLSIDRNNASIPSGSEVAINIGFDSHDIEVGNYNASIVFYSNDPITSSYSIEADLQVCNNTGNEAPSYSNPLDLVGLSINENHSFDLSQAFTDSDGDALIYSIGAEWGDIAEIDLDGHSLNIYPLEEGEDVLEFFVNDGNCNTLSVSEIMTIENILGIEDLSNVHQLTNYPNPFSSETTISYFVDNAQPKKVLLGIYSMQGTLVDILVDRNQSYGEKTLNYENRNLHTGVYFLVLQIDGNRSLSKLIVK